MTPGKRLLAAATVAVSLAAGLATPSLAADKTDADFALRVGDGLLDRHVTSAFVVPAGAIRIAARDLPKDAVMRLTSTADLAITATGNDVTARIRWTKPFTPAATSDRTPVTPRREIPYRNPFPSSAARWIRRSVVVGLNRKIGSMPALTTVCRSGPASSIGRSKTRTPSTPTSAARAANVSAPIRKIGFAYVNTTTAA